MVTSKASTPAEYLAQVPDDRRELVDSLRKTILDNLPDGYEETMSFGMISYVVPLEVFPDTYNGEPIGIVALANQKNYVSVYLMGIYADDAEREWFIAAWKETGCRLDMGKSCVRIKKLEQVPLDVLGEAVRRVPPQALMDAHRAVHG